MMKDGTWSKLQDNEYQVVLTEGNAEVCIIYPPSEKMAKIIIEQWKQGTYKLLHG